MIGCGYWGPNLLRNLHKNPDLDVVAVADADPARRTALASGYPGLRLETDGAAILADEDIDAVVIATPAASHGPLVRAALEAGKDVFVEKPLSLFTEEAEALVALAEERGRILMVGHTFLFNEAVRELKRRLDAGELGRPYYIYSQRLNLGIVRSDVNAAWNLAPHDVSIANYLLDETPIRARASGVLALQPDVSAERRLDDVVFLTLEYPSGVVLHGHVSWLDPRKTRTMTVVGDKKMIVYDDVAQDKLHIYDKGITRQDPVPEEQANDFARHRMITRAGDLLVPNLRVPEPLSVEVAHLAECLRTRATPLSDGRSGVAVTAALEAVERSLALGGAPVDIPSPRSHR